jgi:small subunit ribosomal protein S6
MQQYETLFVQHPECNESQVRDTNERVRRLIEGLGAEITDVQEWGLRELAYPIQKQTRGTYVLLQYRCKPDVVKELERNLKIADEVLRFVSVRMPDKPPPAPRSRQPRQPAEEPEVTEKQES